MRKVWVDVTGLAHAEDSAFERRCALAAVALGDEAAFCRFDPALGHQAVPASEVRRLLQPAEAPGLAPAPAGARGLAKRAIHALPAGVQPRALALARWLARKAGWLPPAGPEPSAQTAPFQAGDVHLALAPHWQPGERDSLLRLKNEVGLQLLATRREMPWQSASAVESWARGRLAKRQDPQECLCVALALSCYAGAGFEDRLQHLYVSLLREGDACIDIGAHTGRHCIPMACAVGATGSVAAFEPNPHIAAQLRARLDAWGAANVHLHQTALSDEAGRAEFVIAVDLPEESGLRERSVYNGPTRTERIEVALTPLDELPLPAPRFIKLDTEGAEYKVLLGARRLLERARPVVAFEFGEASYAAYGVDPAEVHQYFTSLGYAVISILGERLEQDVFMQASRIQAYWDYVACPQAEAPAIAALLRSFKPR